MYKPFHETILCYRISHFTPLHIQAMAIAITLLYHKNFMRVWLADEDSLMCSEKKQMRVLVENRGQWLEGLLVYFSPFFWRFWQMTIKSRKKLRYLYGPQALCPKIAKKKWRKISEQALRVYIDKNHTFHNQSTQLHFHLISLGSLQEAYILLRAREPGSPAKPVSQACRLYSQTLQPVRQTIIIIARKYDRAPALGSEC